jgi:hypothetical protein
MAFNTGFTRELTAEWRCRRRATLTAAERREMHLRGVHREVRNAHLMRFANRRLTTAARRQSKINAVRQIHRRARHGESKRAIRLPNRCNFTVY